MTEFDGKILVIGLGAVSRCTLPLLLAHVDPRPSTYTVIDFAAPEEHARWVRDAGITLVQDRITPENYDELLSRYVGPGDVIVDLSWNVDTVTMLDWCRSHGVRFLNASVEQWDPYATGENRMPREKTLYARQMAIRAMITRWGDNHGPTAVLDHGANPGLVSHFTKLALADIAARLVDDDDQPAALRDRVGELAAAADWARLSQALGVKVIHVSERDTQVSSDPKREDEFVNTWSVEGFYEEGIAPAEMGWGTHERMFPPGTQVHEHGPMNQIAVGRMGCRTWVRSWVPCGDIVGMVIRHGEAFSISEHLSVVEDGVCVYRPTVHYAYCPADAAIASLHELHMRGYDLQKRQRIMGDDIVEGRDELGVLLMGHPYTAWWTGSLLDIHEARSLVPHQNATTLQVAAPMMAAVRWAVENPSVGVRLPDELPYERILADARPYLGPLVSQSVDWTPLQSWHDPFPGFSRRRPSDDDVWQFTTFLVD